MLMWNGLRPNKSLSRRYRPDDVVPRRSSSYPFCIEELRRRLVDAHRTKIIPTHRGNLWSDGWSQAITELEVQLFVL